MFDGEYRPFTMVNDLKTEKVSSLSKLGLITTGIIGSAAVAISIVSLPFISPALRRICLPYVPATNTQVENVLQALKGKVGPVVDLGSGDGRIVLAAAKVGHISTGVELNPWLVWYSKLSALYHGVNTTTRFHKKDLWSFNLKPYKNVVIFGVGEMMTELEEKMLQELPPGAYIIACRFPLPNHTPMVVIGQGIDTVWVYEVT